MTEIEERPHQEEEEEEEKEEKVGTSAKQDHTDHQRDTLRKAWKAGECLFISCSLVSYG